MNNTGIIFIAHGSKKEASNEEFINMTKELSLKLPSFSYICAAFLELASPSIEEVTKEFIEKGVEKIVFYPFFLNSGKHVQIDIPTIVKDLQSFYSNIEFDLLPHFGTSEKIQGLIVNDINEHLLTKKIF